MLLLNFNFVSCNLFFGFSGFLVFPNVWNGRFHAVSFVLFQVFLFRSGRVWFVGKKKQEKKKKTKTSDRYIFLPRDSGTVLTFLLCLVFVWCFFPLFFNVIVTQMQSCWAINIIKLNVILCFHMRFSGSLARRRFKKRSFFFLSFYFEKWKNKKFKLFLFIFMVKILHTLVLDCKVYFWWINCLAIYFFNNM